MPSFEEAKDKAKDKVIYGGGLALNTLTFAQ